MGPTLTTKEAAELLQLNLPKVLWMIRNSVIKSDKKDGVWQIPLSEAIAFMIQREQASKPCQLGVTTERRATNGYV